MKNGAKVLFISQEIYPYLNENPYSLLGRKLPQVAQEAGCETRTFMPKFGEINERRNQLHEVIRLSGMNLIIDDTDHPLIIKVASIQAASHRHFVQVNVENAVGVIEYQRYFAVSTLLSLHRTAKNNVLHVGTTELLCRLFTQYPTHRVRNVTFTAAVRTDDTGNAFVETNDRLIRKRLKAM